MGPRRKTKPFAWGLPYSGDMINLHTATPTPEELALPQNERSKLSLDAWQQILPIRRDGCYEIESLQALPHPKKGWETGILAVIDGDARLKPGSYWQQNIHCPAFLNNIYVYKRHYYVDSEHGGGKDEVAPVPMTIPEVQAAIRHYLSTPAAAESVRTINEVMERERRREKIRETVYDFLLERAREQDRQVREERRQIREERRAAGIASDSEDDSDSDSEDDSDDECMDDSDCIDTHGDDDDRMSILGEDPAHQVSTVPPEEESGDPRGQCMDAASTEEGPPNPTLLCSRTNVMVPGHEKNVATGDTTE